MNELKEIEITKLSGDEMFQREDRAPIERPFRYPL